MKKLLVLIFVLPLFANAQCPNWIDNSIEEALKLLPTVEQYVGFSMRRDGDPFSVERIQYRDSLEYCSFRIAAKKEERYEGIHKIEGPAKVYGISFSGPADAITKLFDKLKQQYSSCPGYKADGQYIMVGSTRIVWTSDTKNGVPVKYIRIDKMQ